MKHLSRKNKKRILRKNKISIIGNGVVVDPWALLEEIKEILC